MSTTSTQREGAGEGAGPGPGAGPRTGATAVPGRAGGHRPALRGLLTGVAVTLVAAAGALVAVGCFLGLYVRPTSDDWCAAWKSRDLGVLGITSDFYSTQNGRVTNAFLSGIIYGDGLAGIKILPTAIVVTFTVGLVLLGCAFVRLLGARARMTTVLALTACALAVQAVVYYAGTRSYQVLLWAPATISHTIPSVIGVWALLLGIRTVREPRAPVRAAGFAAAFVIAFALGTLSEPFALVSGLLAVGVGLLALPRLKLARTWHPFTWCVIWCSGLVCGLIVLYTSPGARWRRAQQPARESMLSPGELKATFRDWLQMWDSVTGQWAYLAAAAVGVLLGLVAGLRGPALAQWTRRRADVPRPVLVAVLLLPVPVVALGSFAVVLGLRSGYGPSGWTYARTWTNYLVPMELALCAYGALLGDWAGRFAARRRHATAAVPATAVAAGALTLAALAALVPNLQQLTTTTVRRSVAWDAQNARIRSEVARGATDVGYRPLYIGSLAEPFFTTDYERDWVADCMTQWYGITRIHRL
ncbi:DUF6056 family protein [Streptomyces roseus]|uniref:DUF6056 family protein n=1 Tax=Streptomyces roseus TaxID=66430 RepID=UPI00069F7656|nr:DUF6056 family protein [Streptomyces roseus]